MLIFEDRVAKSKDKYRKQGVWGDATLIDFWNLSRLSFPDKEIVRGEFGEVLTYQELDYKANQLANYFVEQGLQANDVVTFQIPAWVEFMIIYLAIQKIGAVSNPVLPNLREKELEHILNTCHSGLYICPSQYKKFNYVEMAQRLVSLVDHKMNVLVVNKNNEGDSLGYTSLESVLDTYSGEFECVRRSGDDLAAVMFTSGTEGFPKGVMLTHNNIISSERSFAARLNLNYHDRILLATPPAHALGYHHALTVMIMVGCSCILYSRYKVETVLQEIQDSSCSIFLGPTPFILDMVKVLKEKHYDISSLRYFLCGGAPVPGYLYKEAKKVGINTIGVYGSTESCPHVMHQNSDPIEKICTTDGTPMLETEVKVVDDNRREVLVGQKGEEASRGPAVFMGYMGEPELTARNLDDDGWYYSGDYCVKDEDGYIKIVGRKKDVIVRGGENISCVEVENILLQHSNIDKVAVVGMPDERLGERICAYIVLDNPQNCIEISELQTFFQEMQFDKWICPERLIFVDQLPYTPTGKVKKYLLKKDIAKKIKHQIK